jgi:hypothetical protein
MQIGLGFLQLHEIMSPQRLSKLPQKSLGHAAGVQPQTFGLAGFPPHVSGSVQSPQTSVPVPQPLPMVPQALLGQVLIGVQPQTPGTVPPPQVCGSVHAAQGCPPAPQTAFVRRVIQVAPAQHPEQLVAHADRSGVGREAQRPVPSLTSPWQQRFPFFAFWPALAHRGFLPSLLVSLPLPA